jgi:propionyl-CoA carboxylase alpha chain
MLAKVIAHRGSRADAARLLATSLRRAKVHGVQTNRDLLVRILEDDGFRDQGATTDYLEGVESSGLIVPLVDPAGIVLAAAAAALFRQAEQRRQDQPLAALPSGWRNSPSTDQVRRFAGPQGEIEVRYRFGRDNRLITLVVDGDALPAPQLEVCEPDRTVLSIDGVARRFEVTSRADVVFVNSAIGQVALRELPTFSGEEVDSLPEGAIVAPMPGSVIRLQVEPGQAVAAREQLVVLEAMKMEHEIVAPTDGTVEAIHVGLGDLVSAGQVLVNFIDDPNEMEEPG